SASCWGGRAGGACAGWGGGRGRPWAGPPGGRPAGRGGCRGGRLGGGRARRRSGGGRLGRGGRSLGPRRTRPEQESSQEGSRQRRTSCRHDPLPGKNARLALLRSVMTTRTFLAITALSSAMRTSRPRPLIVVPARVISTAASVRRFRSPLRQVSSGVRSVRPSLEVTTTFPWRETSWVWFSRVPSSPVTVHVLSLVNTLTTTFFITVFWSLSKTSAWSASRVQRRFPARVSLMWISLIW